MTTHLPSPPLSTPTVTTKQLQFPPSSRPRPSYLLPFPIAAVVPPSKIIPSCKPPPTPSSLSLADPSSDPSSSPSTSKLDFNQSLLTHLKPPRALASSSSPFFPPTSHPARETPRARNVNFSATPLGSLNASPRHRPYSIPSSKRRAKPTSIYSHPSFDLLPPLSDLSNSSSPAARSHRRIERKPLPVVQPEEDEGPTDDEADEDAVEHLLLSQEQLAVSPLRIQAFSLPFPDRAPRGILKKWHHPILQVQNALEGCKRNGGRRKHTLSFWDAEAGAQSALLPDARSCVTAVVLQELAGNGGKSGTGVVGVEETGGREGGRRTRSDATRTGAAGKVGGGGDASDDGDDDRRRIGPPVPPPEFIMPKDDDPVHLLSPLMVLRASLRTLSRRTANADEHSPGLAPRSTTSTRCSSPLHASMRRSPATPASRPNFDDLEDGIDDDPASASDLPRTLHEVESAYLALVRALIRHPATLPDESRTLEPLRQYRVSLLRCLERDLSNILSFPSATRASTMSRDLAVLHGSASSSGSGSSSPAREDGTRRSRTGLSDAEMRRQKDEVGVAQAAIKCAAALVQHQRLSSIFTPSELSTVLSLILRIPGSPGLSSSVHKDVYPFVAWFLNIQRLSLPLLDPHLPRILFVLRTILATPDKPRHNLVEGISAIGRFLLTHPETTLVQWDKWLYSVMEGLLEVPKKGMAVRLRSVATLGAVVRALVTKWNSTAEGEQAAKEKKRRDAFAVDIGNTFEGFLKRTTSDPNHPTCLTLLFEQLAKALRTDEAPWAVNVIALVPALLKHKFRRLETAGVRPWVSLVNEVRIHSSLHLRALGNLLWNHLVFAFLSTSHTNPPTVGTLSWSFGEGRLNVLTGVFSTQRSVWIQYDRVSQVQREKATVLAQVLAGAVYGLSVLNRAPLVVDPAAPDAVDPQFEQYDILWARLVAGGWIKDVPRGASVAELEAAEAEGKKKFVGDEVVTAIRSRYEETAIIGWSILAAIVKPPSEVDRHAGVEALVNAVFLDGSVAKTKVPTAQALLIARALAKAPQPVAIPGWSTRWTVANGDKVSEMVDTCLGGERRADLTDLCIAPFWRNFMSAFAAEPENPAMETGLLAIVDWFERLPTLVIAGAGTLSSLTRILIGTTVDVLGERLLRLPLNADGEQPFYRLATAFFGAGAMTEQEATRFEPLTMTMLQSAMGLTANPLPLLASATSSFAFSQVPTEVLAFFIPHWTKALLLTDLQETLAVADLESLVKLLRSFRRDSAIMGAWQELAKSTLNAIFTLGDSTTALSDSFSELLGRTELCGDLEFLLLSVSEEQPATVQGFISSLASSALCSLVKDIGTNGDLATNMLEIAPESLLVTLYSAVLLTLQGVVTPTSSELETLIPFLAPPLTRALSQDDCGDAVIAFHNFWVATFASLPLRLEMPDEFRNLLSIIGKVSVGGLPNVYETQCQPQASTSTLPPPAGQRSPATGRGDEHSMSPSSYEQSGRGYEADISMALESTRTSIPASHRVPISPSLRLPDPSTDAIPPPIKEESVTGQIDETPPEELAKAAVASQKRRASAKRSRSPSPLEPPPKSLERIESTNSIIIDDSDDEDSVVAPARAGRSHARSSSNDGTSQGSSKSRSKKAKVAVVAPAATASKAARGEKRRAKSGQQFEVEVEVKRRAKGDTNTSAGPSLKRRRTPKGSIDVGTDDKSRSTPSQSPLHEDEQDVLRRVLDRSPGGVVEAVGALGGSPLLRKLAALGERATQFLSRGG